jgi:hypothetical protein
MSTNLENLLFKMIERPNNFYKTKINNVYSNRYRINIYCEEEKENLIKRKICASYFCILSKDNKLHIIHGNPLNNKVIS